MDGSVVVDNGGFVDIEISVISPVFKFSGIRFREILEFLFQFFESIHNGMED